MSYKETKQSRNLAKLAIFNSEPYGTPLPTHFSPTQFKLAAMNNFNHSDASSLTGISVAQDIALTLFQIKPTGMSSLLTNRNLPIMHTGFNAEKNVFKQSENDKLHA